MPCIIRSTMSSPLPSERPVTATDLLHAGLESPPFVLMLEGSDGKETPLSCEELIRVIPGKRLVCRGAWGGKDVFVKLYLGSSKHWQSELRGLQALHAAAIAAPRVVHAGTADHGTVHVILL
jgi:hypothetical protein